MWYGHNVIHPKMLMEWLTVQTLIRLLLQGQSHLWSLSTLLVFAQTCPSENLKCWFMYYQSNLYSLTNLNCFWSCCICISAMFILRTHRVIFTGFAVLWDTKWHQNQCLPCLKKLGAVAQSDAPPPGMQMVVGITLTSTNVLSRDWSWNPFYGHSLPTADSSRAVVS